MNARAMDRLNLGLPNDPVLVGTATFQCDISQHGRIIVVNAATSTLTLPQANGSGWWLRIILGIVAVSVIIKRALAADRMQGSIETLIDTSATGKAWQANTTANANTITMNGSTTGGATIGDEIELIDIAKGVIAVRGQIMGSGGISTPFSNT
jgi:hypothetical protein